MSCNPCFSVDLRTGVKFLACLDIFLDSLVIFFVAAKVYFPEFYVPDPLEKSEFEQLLTSVENAMDAIPDLLLHLMLVVAIIQLIPTIALFSGAHTGKSERCLVWLVFAISFIFYYVFICFFMFVFVGDGDLNSFEKSFPFWFVFIRFVYVIFEIIVVVSFRYQLNCAKSSNHREDVEEASPQGLNVMIPTIRSVGQSPSYTTIPQTPPPDYSSIVDPQTPTAPNKSMLFP